MKKTVAVYWRTIKLMLGYAPKPWLALNLTLLLAQGILTGYHAKVTQYFYDTVIGQSAAPDGFLKIIQAGVFLGLFALTTHAVSGAGQIVGSKFHMDITSPLTELSNLKTARIDPICFDNPAYLDDIDKSSNAVRQLNATFSITSTVLCLYLVNFIIMTRYLYTLDPVLCVMPLVVFIPIVLTQFARTGAFAKLEDASAPLRRETGYYQDCVGRREVFKETRVLNAFGYFKNLYSAALDILNRETWRAERKGAWLDFISKLLSLLGFGLVLFLLVRSVSGGKISVGAFAAVFASIDGMFSLMEELVIHRFGRLSRNFGYVHNYFRFLDLPEREGDDTPVTLTRGIEVENVTFRYPGKDFDALKNVSLAIPAGETLAVVGENGSGKSTLVKLLLGLYLPQKGRVSYDGRDIQNASCAGLTHKTSAVFQDYMRYKLTIKDNIAISDLAAAERDCGYGGEINSLLQYTTGDPVAVTGMELLSQMEIDMSDEKYPKGINTLLDREFGGIDLSGGQWQKVAIARGLYRSHHLIALDEPTAAIDPIEESRLYRRFMEISKGVTSIIVTHRLGSVRIADRIAVMDQGEIVQIGTHDELVGVPGKYAEMWRAQAQYYT